MGMAQSVSLPSGMLESLGQYKEALKEIKKELRDAEREGRRQQKGGGTVSRETAGRLDTARGSRARLEDAIVAQKVANRSGGGTSIGASVGAGYAGSALNKMYSPGDAKLFGSIQKATGYITDKISGRLSYKAVSTLANISEKGMKFASKRLGGAGIAGWNEKLVNSYELSASISRKIGGRFDNEKAFSHAVRHAGGFTDLMQSAVKRIGGLVTVGVAIGTAINDVRAGRIGMDSARAESIIGTEKMYGDILGSVGFGGTASRNYTDIKKATQGVGKSHADALVNSGIYRYLKTKLYGGDKEAIALEDKITQNSLRRTMTGLQHGSRFSEQMSDEWIMKNMKTKFNAKMWENMGLQNKVANSISAFFGSDRFLDYYIFSDGLTATRNKVLEELKIERESKWNEEEKNAAKLWNNRMDTTRALARADEHERTNAITSFQNDRLTRGLTW